MEKFDATRSTAILDQIAFRERMLPADRERYLWLAIAGEVGEACNLVKKQWRDGLTPERTKALFTEAADVYIYLRVLERFYGVNLDQLATEKMKLVETRPYASVENVKA